MFGTKNRQIFPICETSWSGRVQGCEVRLRKLPYVSSRFQGIKSLSTLIGAFSDDDPDFARARNALVGTVADLITPMEGLGSKLNTALSEELGNRLFNVVVRDARTATWWATGLFFCGYLQDFWEPGLFSPHLPAGSCPR